MELNIETMTATLDRFGLVLDGLFATADGPDDDGEYAVSMSGEIQGTPFGDDAPTLVGAIYDGAGRVVGTCEHWLNDFAGFDTFDLADYAKAMPARVRFFVRA